MSTAVIVPAGPHYKNAADQEQVWFGRIFAAIKLARHHSAPLIIVGDANGGADVALFAKLATECGLVVFVEHNGADKSKRNTRGDMQAAARVLRDVPALHGVDQMILVSCWYHCPRAAVELRAALNTMLPDWPYSLDCAPVWDNLLHGLYRLLHHHGELRGIADALLNRPHTPRGSLASLGKPDLS